MAQPRPVVKLYDGRLPEEVWHNIFLFLPGNRRLPARYVSHTWRDLFSDLDILLYQRYEAQPEQGIEVALARGDWWLVLKLLPLAPQYVPDQDTANHQLFRTLRGMFFDPRQLFLQWALEIGQEEIALYYLNAMSPAPLPMSLLPMSASMAASTGLWYTLRQLLPRTSNQEGHSTHLCWAAALKAVLTRRDNRMIGLLFRGLPPFTGVELAAIREIVAIAAARNGYSGLLEEHWPWLTVEKQGMALYDILHSATLPPSIHWIIAHTPKKAIQSVLNSTMMRWSYLLVDRPEEVAKVRLLCSALPSAWIMKRATQWLAHLQCYRSPLVDELRQVLDEVLARAE
jgi:hypothetical protein